MPMTVICPICEHQQKIEAIADQSRVTQVSCTGCHANLVLSPSHRATTPCASRAHWATEAIVNVPLSIGLRVLLCILTGLGSYGVWQGLRISEPYELSKAFVRHNPQIEQLVGAEMEFDWFPKSHIQVDEQGGSGEFHLMVSGTTGSAVVHVRLDRRQQQWQIVEAGYADPTGTYKSLLPTRATSRPEGPHNQLQPVL
ncbi:hypothetical protein COMA1_10892 [Candidatus Nitrospira nitrosa]|uniref:Uncharacterized protein n=2 Tax=Candidatus Nitrospira nitrosa TaxID=1742972 RepID=A0A0S4L5I3_9BACT|nr:hypothetical protein COMA1_10892 [Candidatus Nitrospira nitrosa]